MALLGRDGTDRTWSRWANVGDAFGALNSLLSGLAVAAIVVTFLVQFQELKVQRTDLAQARAELRRSAEAELRKLHVELIKMAIDDPNLAAVWPPLTHRHSRRQNNQHLYANLILQHAWLQRRYEAHTETEMLGYLRYLFTSANMRHYWRASQKARTSILVPGTAEFLFNEAADQACREHEALVTPAVPERSTKVGRGSTGGRAPVGG